MTISRPFFGPTHLAQLSVNERLSLHASGTEQDWELELASPALLPAILDLYEDESLSLEERSALALLCIACIERAVEEGKRYEDFAERARQLLADDPAVRARMSSYWITLKNSNASAVVHPILLEPEDERT